MPLPKEVLERLARSREEIAAQAAGLTNLEAPARRFADFGSAKRAKPFPPGAEPILADFTAALGNGADSSNQPVLGSSTKNLVDLSSDQENSGEASTPRAKSIPDSSPKRDPELDEHVRVILLHRPSLQDIGSRHHLHHRAPRRTPTFLTMAYILVVNASIISNSGATCSISDCFHPSPSCKFPPEVDPDYTNCVARTRHELLTTTVVESLIGSALMGFFANLPIALAPGMGTNAYSVVGFHESGRILYRSALTAVFLEGPLIVLSIFGDIEKASAGANAMARAEGVSISCGF
ncbi:Adenine/guanine permease AZG1 [Platanthera zijinensis]|uniref:Adenine/guanine permease AZG1 n=1 Tax=Platanthera zijinensis TaxID=2320716 RepID=A0AAP0BF23_9ASPA